MNPNVLAEPTTFKRTKGHLCTQANEALISAMTYKIDGANDEQILGNFYLITLLSETPCLVNEYPKYYNNIDVSYTIRLYMNKNLSMHN